MRYDSIRFDSIDGGMEGGGGRKGRRGTMRNGGKGGGEAYEGTFEFSRGDWTGVSCAKQGEEGWRKVGNGEKETRVCKERDLIRDSRHLNSLFRYSHVCRLRSKPSLLLTDLSPS